MTSTIRRLSHVDLETGSRFHPVGNNEPELKPFFRIITMTSDLTGAAGNSAAKPTVDPRNLVAISAG